MPGFHQHHLFVALIAANLLPLSIPAFSSGDHLRSMEEVTVTARRRAESIQDVPMAITALDAVALEKAGIKDVQDLQYVSPGVSVSPGFFGKAIPGFSMRGQRVGEALATQDNSVIVYMDDVPMNRPHGVGQILYDLDSVQVLKGPQGTLFGRNTTGGAILANIKRPDFDQVSGFVKGLAGNYDHYSGEAAVNIPVADNFALRMAGKVVRRDGFTDNLADGRKLDDDSNESYRISALWAPTQALEVFSVFQKFDMDTNGVGWKINALNPAGAHIGYVGAVAGTAAVNAYFDQLTQLQSKDFHSVFNDQYNQEEVDTWHFSNTIEWDLGDITLKNIFGYRDIETYSAFDYDGSSVGFILPGDGQYSGIFNSYNINDGDQISNEIQALGTALNESLDWIVGGFYFNEENYDYQYSELFGRRENIGTGINTSRSLFASVSYQTPIAGLSLTAGYRYTWDKRELEAESTIQGTTSPALSCRLTDANGALDPCFRAVSKNFSGESWTVSADYAFTDNVLAYVAHRRGYRSGGWNLRSIGIEDTVPYNPETVDDIEFGFKSTFATEDVNGFFNIAYFYQWYEDIQRTVTAPIGAGGSLVTTVVNAAEAKIQGIEAEAGITTDQLKLTGFLGWIDAEFDEFIDYKGGVPVDFSDRQFDNVPELTAGLTAQWFIPVDDSLGDLSVTLNWYMKDEIHTDATNDGSTLPAYELTNLYLDWERVMESRIDVRLFVKNAFDKEYLTSGIQLNSALGYETYTLGDPKTYGVQVKYSF